MDFVAMRRLEASGHGNYPLGCETRTRPTCAACPRSAPHVVFGVANASSQLATRESGGGCPTKCAETDLDGAVVDGQCSLCQSRSPLIPKSNSRSNFRRVRDDKIRQTAIPGAGRNQPVSSRRCRTVGAVPGPQASVALPRRANHALTISALTAPSGG